MKQIKSIEEIQSILLNIAKAFQGVCDEHNIPFYMIGGTMLGAVRHKGFIPWDDDMDFGIPRPYYQKAIDLLEKELPYPYRCCTFKNNPAVRFCFFKVDDYSTLLEDPRVPLPKDMHLGVNIDIFPLDYCETGDKIVKKVMFLRKLNRVLYVNSPEKNLKQRIKNILRIVLPVPRSFLLKKQESLLEQCPQNGPILANVYGRWKELEFIPTEWYGNMYFQFEDTQFPGIQEYDSYLTQLYGDYLIIPPEDSRVPHFSKVYYR